jgi:hypothetical protein
MAIFLHHRKLIVSLKVVTSPSHSSDCCRVNLCDTGGINAKRIDNDISMYLLSRSYISENDDAVYWHRLHCCELARRKQSLMRLKYWLQVPKVYLQTYVPKL